MFKNSFLISFRQLKSNKGFSLLNIFGLAFGIACAVLIGLWVKDEISYDRFHENYDNIYQVMETQDYDGETFTFPAEPGPLAAALKKEIPEIKNTVRTDWGSKMLFSRNEKRISEEGLYTDPSFFEIFSFPAVKGNPAAALQNIHSLVITESMAKRFFGNENALGQMLKIDNTHEFKIGAIVKDPQANSTFQFSWLAPYTLFEEKNQWSKDWTNNGVRTYAELMPGTDKEKINKKLYNFITKKDAQAAAHPFLFNMSDWRLRSNFKDGKQNGGRIEYVKLFSIIALIIILIACINFMNLATARSEQRAREIGVRKVLGVSRRALIKQFIGEALFMSFAATLLACFIVWLSLPAFNKLVEKSLTFNLAQLPVLLSVIGVALFSGLLAGSYPSFYLSSFNPITAFKGLRSGKNSFTISVRKGLVVTQFIVSIVLIISTIIIYQQVQFVKNRNIGYDKEELIYMPLNAEIRKHMTAIHSDLLATGAVENSATSENLLLTMGSMSDGIRWQGQAPDSKILITDERVNPSFVSTVGLKLKEGRDFYQDGSKDSSNVIINETLEKLMNKKTVVGEMLHVDSSQLQIIGVVKDFVYDDMYAQPQPLIFFCKPGTENIFYLRMKKNVNLEDGLRKVEAVMKKHDPSHPFEYTFFNETFNQRFKSEMTVSDLSRLFAGLAILISCIGLFGLAAYTASRRTKEIGIRKVLGADVITVVRMLSKDFLKLIVIAALTAFPLAWWIMHKWLQNYAYRTSISWWIFIAAGALTLLIALFTVSFQAIRAAVANPVKSLRTE